MNNDAFLLHCICCNISPVKLNYGAAKKKKKGLQKRAHSYLWNQDIESNALGNKENIKG